MMHKNKKQKHDGRYTLFKNSNSPDDTHEQKKHLPKLPAKPLSCNSHSSSSFCQPVAN